MSDDKDALIYLANVRIEELNAESAKLRHDLEEANNQAEEVCIENAKLRELVRIAGTYCVNGLCGKDDGCPLYLGKPYCASWEWSHDVLWTE